MQLHSTSPLTEGAINHISLAIVNGLRMWKCLIRQARGARLPRRERDAHELRLTEGA